MGLWGGVVACSGAAAEVDTLEKRPDHKSEEEGVRRVKGCCGLQHEEVGK